MQNWRLGTFSVLSLLFSATLSASAAKGLVIAQGGRTGFTIVREADAAPQTVAAAWDMSRILERATGASFAIRTPQEVADGCPTIEVGTRRGEQLAGERRMRALGPDGSLSLCDGKSVVLVGRGGFGISGAVYDFLEERVGCRWFTMWDNGFVPRLETLNVKPFEKMVNPPMEMRFIQCLQLSGRRMRNANWFLFRHNQNFTDYAKSYHNIDLPPGMDALPSAGYFCGYYSHSLFRFIPPKAGNSADRGIHCWHATEWKPFQIDGVPKEGYFASHPDWFTLRFRNGKPVRMPDQQLCFSNPELRKTLRENFFAFVAACDGKGVFNLSAMDVEGSFCDCGKCKALSEKYGCVGAPLFCMIYALASELEKRYPEARLSTLVYRKNQTQKPPNATFPHFPKNFIATFAPIDDDFSKEIAHPNNAETLADLKLWKQKADNIWTWYYPIPYGGLYPYSGIRRSSADIRTMLAAGLTGSGWEHDVGRDCGANFYDLQTYVAVKLFRDPSLDEEKLAEEFCRGCYGAAGDMVYRYRLELEDLREKCPSRVSWIKFVPTVLEVDRLRRWTGEFDEMERLVADDPPALQCVKEARLGLEYAVLSRYPVIRRSYPDYPYSPDDVFERVTNTLARAYSRRGVAPSAQGGATRSFSELRLVAMAPDERPPEFSEVPEDDYGQSLGTVVGSVRRRPMHDSVVGAALWDDGEDNSDRKVYTVWIYDVGARRELSKVEIHPDLSQEGKFTFHHIGRIAIPQDAIVACGFSWRVKFSLSNLYVPGTDDKWDVYVAAKFEGPKWYPGSTRPNRAAMDRIVVVKAKGE